MKLKSLILNLTKEDILNLISLQDKILIDNLELNNEIKLSGIYKLVGLNVNFYTSLRIDGFKNNIISIDINDFQISKKSSLNPLVKGTISIINKSINDIDGVNIDNKSLTIDIERVIKVYCTDNLGIKLDKLNINSLNSQNGYIELAIDTLDITLSDLKNIYNFIKNKKHK
jgi:hypothetical protein